MPAPTTIQSLADASCFASARRWCSHAEILRDSAEASTLTPCQRSTLLRQAEAADRQAEWWLAAVKDQ